MNAEQQSFLRLQPEAIPAVRTAVTNALDQLGEALGEVRRRGVLVTPWLGDEASKEVAAHYSRRAMDEPNSSYQALAAYRTELRRIHDTLQQMEDHYRRTEGDNAALWGRKA